MAEAEDPVFAKLTGKGGEQTNLNFLRGENNALKGEVARLNNELIGRAVPTLSNFTDAVRVMTGMAQSGSPQALEQLKLLKAALDGAFDLIESKKRILIPR